MWQNKVLWVQYTPQFAWFLPYRTVGTDLTLGHTGTAMTTQAPRTCVPSFLHPSQAPFPFWGAGMTDLYYTPQLCHPVGDAQVNTLCKGPHLAVPSVTQVYQTSTFSISWLPIYIGSRAAPIKFISPLTAEQWFSNCGPGTMGSHRASEVQLRELERIKKSELLDPSIPPVPPQQFCFFPN